MHPSQGESSSHRYFFQCLLRRPTLISGRTSGRRAQSLAHPTMSTYWVRAASYSDTNGPKRVSSHIAMYSVGGGSVYVRLRQQNSKFETKQSISGMGWNLGIALLAGVFHPICSVSNVHRLIFRAATLRLPCTLARVPHSSFGHLAGEISCGC